MNDFGDFFCALRKEKGMTQAEIADKLGVTNKAVSKWETGESMPDTSLLKPIADLFNVTVDELLSGKRAETTKEDKQEQRNNKDEIKQHLFTRGKDDEPESLLDKICGVLCAMLMLSGVITFLCLGIFKDLWNPCWVILPACALGCGIIGTIFDLCNPKKRKEKIEKGENPYTGCTCGIIMLVCIITYLILGAVANLWHPYWLIIVVGGCICGCVGSIGKIFVFKKENKEENDEME